MFLRDQIAVAPGDPDVRDHALLAYQLSESVRRRVAQLLSDPSLGTEALAPNHLQLYKRWNESAALVESYLLPFIERYADTDRRLTRLCRRLTDQVAWPLPAPLVVGISSQYYWTVPEFNVVCTPTAEATTLLGLPDLCHELGHVLLVHNESTLVGDFLQEVAEYIREERRRVATGQRPPEYEALYDGLFAQWSDEWVREFVCDMVATYLLGPAFGWQHLRLCAGRSRVAYHPALGEVAEHPSDEARLRGIVATLEQLGAADLGTRLHAMWGSYLTASGESRPAEYDVCYPQRLIAGLARRTVDGCRGIGLRSFSDSAHHGSHIPSLIGEAWDRFLADPDNYGDWERPQMEALWRELGFGG